MKTLSLGTRICLFIGIFTLVCVASLMLAIGIGFRPYFSMVKKEKMLFAGYQIKKFYKEHQLNYNALGQLGYDLGADIVIVHQGEIIYTTLPIYTGPEDISSASDITFFMTPIAPTYYGREELQYIQVLRDLLEGKNPSPDKLDKVQHSQRNREFQYFSLVGKIDANTYYIICSPMSTIGQYSSVIQQFIVTIGLIWIFAALCLSFFVSRWITLPLRELQHISAAMAKLDFTKRWRQNRTDEIGSLGKSFNDLARQLQGALAARNKVNNRLQHELFRIKELESMRQKFLFAVSHELKTPLAIIQGYAEGLETLSLDEETQRKYCRIIQREAGKMGGFVKDLLDVSRLEMGTLELQPVFFDFAALIYEVQEQFSQVIRNKNIKAHWDIPHKITVFGDPARIEVIINNLISNAIDYTSPNHEMRVFVEDIPQGYRINIYNQGITIPPDEQKLIWQPFYKVDTSRTRKIERTFGGHGLGLGIVAALVSLHCESYGMRNETDGVTFWFTLSKDEAKYKKSK
ncbi:HAMP domain-containing sensor histidine kinase [uncultured Megasphaera sp.]|uniref:HAMP domain-containing sensor histidine kinase n=2 Tax=uncultured Megasphaera sp. TaxID=165188 RepID=UPI002598B36D|nr:HAMP domain-containing sensor histidine kinase [uncultured Megasphaera sp.]